MIPMSEHPKFIRGGGSLTDPWSEGSQKHLEMSWWQRELLEGVTLPGPLQVHLLEAPAPHPQ